MRAFYPTLCCVTVITAVMGCISASESIAQGLPNVREDAAPTKQGEALGRFIAAAFSEETGNRDESLEQLREVTALDPNALTPAITLMRVLYSKDAFDEALAVCNRALDHHEDRADLWVEKGKILQNLERYDEARECIQKALDIQPDSVVGVDALVKLQETTNDLVAEIQLFEGLIDLVPNSSEMHYRLGTLLIRADDPKGARAVFEKALILNPNLVLARKWLGILYLEANENERAVMQLAQYLRADPRDTSAAEALAGALTRIGRYAEAMKIFNSLLARPDAAPKHQLGIMYVTLVSGYSQNAERMNAPGAPILGAFFKAIARQDMGQPYAPLLESLDDIDGDLDSECTDQLNSLLYQFGEEKAGGWLLDRIKKFEASDVTSRRLRIIHGRLLMTMKRYDEAAAVLEEAVDPADKDPQIHYYLALCYDYQHDFDNAERHLKAYLAIDGEDPDVLNFLGYMYAEHNVKLKQAEQLVNKALQAEPNSPYFMDSLGWIYYRQNKADKAIDIIQRAIYLMPSDDAVLRDHLGDAYLLKGDTVRALKEWRKAIRLDPSIEGLAEKISKYSTAV